MAVEQPDAGEKFTPRDHPEWLGKLFIIRPKSVEMVNFTNQQTGQPEPSKIVACDVAIVDLIDPQTGKPKVLRNARVAGKGIVPQIEGKIGSGDDAGGRLMQLPAQGQKSGAYILDRMTDTDKATANAFVWPTTVEQAAPPTGAVSNGQATGYPANGNGNGQPWFVTDGMLLQKLLAAGVANPAQFSYEAAQMMGSAL